MSIRCVLFGLMLTATPAAFAQICPTADLATLAAKYHWDYVGDGCSTTYNGVPLATIPNIGLYRDLFTPSCDAHDRCYISIGSDESECDSQFFSNMKAACRSKFDPIFFPFQYVDCNATASMYYSAVRAYSATNPTISTSTQSSLYESEQLQYGKVEPEVCGTTPERVGLYSPKLINTINSIWQANAGRLPSIYEFLASVSLERTVVINPAAWQSAVISKAASAPKTLPNVSTTIDVEGGLVRLSSPSAANYLWKVSSRTASGTTFPLFTSQPKYDTRYELRGFVRGTSTSNTAAKNQAVIDTWVYVPGWCSPRPGIACY